MALANLVGCDMCDAIAPNGGEGFFFLEGEIGHRHKDNTEVKHFGSQAGNSTVLCPRCAGPILMFLSALENVRVTADKRMQERLLEGLEARKRESCTKSG